MARNHNKDSLGRKLTVEIPAQPPRRFSNERRKHVKARTMILVSAILTLAVNLQAADDPLFGVWKLNVAKSKYSPGPAPKSQFLTYEPAGNNAVKLTTDIVDAQGWR